MDRVYFVKEKINDYYILNTVTSFDYEDIYSASDDIITYEDVLVDKYVSFVDEKINKIDDRLVISGKPILLTNSITELDKKTYDYEFELSINAYRNNDSIGIDRWNKYLKEYEAKCLDFVVISPSSIA